MAQTTIVISVLPQGKTRIAATTNVNNALRQWRRRHGVFLPIAAFECDPVAFCNAAQIPRLPKIVDIEWAAEHFYRAPLSQSAQPAVLRHIRQLGDESGPLVLEWAGAVLKAAGKGK